MRLIAIDLDGTLEDSRADMAGAAARVRAALGLPERALEALRQHVNGGMDALYRACFDDFLAADGSENYERYALVKQRYEADYLDNVAVQTRLYAGIAEALPELARIGSLCCVTNKPEHISRALLQALGVGAHFASVVGGDSCAHCKPHPIMLETAALRCRLAEPRAPAFMIGDTQADVRLGRAYGATTVWCAWGYADALAERADFEARTPAELARIVRGAAA